MDYAIQLLLPILGGLLLGGWLVQTFHVSPLWTVGLAVLGMIAGLGILYKRFSDPSVYKKIPPRSQSPDAPGGMPYEDWKALKRKAAESTGETDTYKHKDDDDWDKDDDD